MDSKDFFENLQEFNSRFVEAVQIMTQKKIDPTMNPFMDVLGIHQAYLEAVTDFTNNPSKFLEHNLELASKVSNLMFHFMDKISGNNPEPLYESPRRDRRFKDKTWEESLYFNFVKQFYLMSSDWYRSLVQKLEVPESKKRLLEFYTEQMINASSPTNFINLNPEVLNEMIASNGKNLIQGIENFVADLKNSDNIIDITTADKSVFSLGKNIASTEGKVIYQNDLAQLICYKPLEKSQSIPFFIVPPWINKYYILDLSKENSFIQFLVNKGFQVYLISWVNPGSSYATKNFEDYLREGILEPTEFLKKNFGYEKFNTIGYCLGGTLLACANAYLTNKGNNPFASSTYLTTLLDFSDPGDLGLFINSNTIEAIKEELKTKGYFSGKYMSHAFSLLRANELIWSFVVNNYLLGKKPLAFDLLFWNSDTTNLPAAMHSFYLENMYINNALVQPGGIKLLGVVIDLSKIHTPSFFLSTIEDHIAPWASTFSGTKLFKQLSDLKFCLAGSGHIAGVVNPPVQKKYSYWVNDKLYEDPNTWLNHATEHQGSWWEYWADWAKEKSGEVVKAIDYDKINFIENAPGTYAKMRNE